jgi:eukaryotic-like serine/threonine-protein kinase
MLAISDRSHWHKLKDILAEAMEETSPERRAETLRQACADNAKLLREAETLLSQDTTVLEHFAEFAASCLRDDLPSRVGERLGAYSITREIGRGGMGAVYLAQRADGQFEKQVAIKILKRGTDTEEVVRRFRAERQILANLEHSNITRLLDAGVTRDNLPYVVMEFVDGKPITRFVQDKNCSLFQSIELFLKVCSAVELAHRQGVIHRDIKPSNILVTSDGELKLLDFGIAKVVAGNANDVTVAIDRRLTPKYAAPEQRTSEYPTIATDIYSLGILLAELIEKTSNPQGSSFDSVRCLGNVVKHATHLKPERRYPSAGALARAVKECVAGSPRGAEARYFGGKRLAVAGAILLLAALLGGLLWQKRSVIFNATSSSSSASPIATKIHSIAVLPFDPLPRDENDLLGLGMADAIIGRLSGLKQLVVLPTAAVSRFRGQSEDPIAAGKQLNVDAVLDGTVQQSEGRIRVTVQLINVGSRRTLWADTLDQTSTDIFAIQDSISEKVARSLLVNLSEADRQQLEKHYTGDTAAYDSYLLGVEAYNLRTKEGLQKAIDYFQQAIASDPHYALAYAVMADAYCLKSYYGYEPSSVVVPKARAAAEKALDLDSSLPEAHLAISMVQPRNSPDSPGIQSLVRAIRLNPNYALAHQRYAWFLCSTGQLEESIQEMNKAQMLDPLSGTHNTALGSLLIFAHRYAEGLRYCERAIELNPNQLFIQGNLANAYLLNNKYEEAITTFRRMEETNPSQHGDVLAQIATVLVDAGRTEEADKLMPEITALANAKKVDPYNMALLFVARGDNEKAMYWLRQPASMGLSSPGLLRYDPQLDPIRSDARFQAFLQKFNEGMSKQ